jgi:branched-chain amino acid transport system substrate-binding protein
MASHIRSRGSVVVALAVGVSLAIAGCSSGGSSSSTTTAAASGGSASLGTPNPAKGSPVLFGVLNLQSGPVTFPEALQGEQAAVSYVNEYKNGIDGHPIKLATCVTDGSPATSQRCANQILDQKPVAILGAADTGAPGAFPVWERAGLAYIGGVPFTPVEQNSPNAVIFSSVSTADNAAASVFAAKTLHAKSASVIYTSDTQGTSVAENVIIPTMKNAGISKVSGVSIPPTASDVSSAVATAVGSNPDVIYINAPAACPNILSSLKQLGNTAHIIGIDPCTSPAAIKGANGGAEGMYFASPVLDSQAGTAETKLYLNVLKKYAPANVALDSITALGFQTVMDLESTIGKFTTADLTKDKILAAFRSGSNHPNFMGHPYTCDGKQLVGATAVCNAYQQIRVIKNGVPTVAQKGWVTAGAYYTGKP